MNFENQLGWWYFMAMGFLHFWGISDMHYRKYKWVKSSSLATLGTLFSQKLVFEVSLVLKPLISKVHFLLNFIQPGLSMTL